MLDALTGKSVDSLGSRISYYAGKQPNKMAVQDSRHSLTYAELDKHSLACAAALSQWGITRGDRIICFAQKEVSLVAAIIGCLRLGVGYVPVDPKNPPGRLQHIAREIAPKAVILPEKMLAEAAGLDPEIKRIPLESISPFHAKPCHLTEDSISGQAWPDIDISDMAYCMYTSGSTGMPKGVVIEHRSMLAFFAAVNEFMNITEESVCMNTSPFYFDVSIVDTLLPLYCGASVYLYDEFMIPSLVLQYIARRRITHFAAVAPILSLLSEEPHFGKEDFSSLKRIMTGAEVLNVKSIQRWLQEVPALTIINGYGPTEATCVCLAHPITAANVNDHHLFPIGRPLTGINALLIDQAGEIIETPGVSGELLVAGDQLMRGYWSNPEATKSRLVAIHGEVYYRTGDICQQDEQGLYHFIGRGDDEVKILGYRINLNEIRGAIGEIPLVKDFILSIIHEEGRGKVLAAAIILKDGDPELGKLADVQAALKDKLLDYMVPRYLLLCTGFPKLPSGKTDAKRIARYIEEQIKHNKTSLHLQSADWP
ncbi:amino acid adenylation domain-containing protein [Paenibacillus sp. FSL W8-0186]|uniref:amino acid adenylation domain-containing protein n=1 Tax=Paenibacillus sp. FSL W8-0186 TaxID=2921709 RepID=UPI0030CDD659